MTILSIFTHHIYLRVGDIERAWPMKSVVPNALIQFDSNTFPADTRVIFHTRAIFLTSILYDYTRMLVLISFYGVLIYPIFLASWLMIESSYSLLYSGYREGPIFTYHFPTRFWSVAGASRPCWSLDRNTMESTLRHIETPGNPAFYI